MVDQQKNTSPDDEYQFPQEEYIASGDADASQQSVEKEAPVEMQKSAVEKIMGAVSNLSPFLQRNKRVVIIIVVLFFGYLFLHFGMSKKTPVPVQSPQPAPEQIVSTPVQQPDNGAMLGSLDSLKTNSSEATSDIKNLQSQVSDLQNAVSQSQSQNDQLRNAIGALAEQIKDVSVQLDKVMARGAPAKRGSEITYHLRAVIPDRAWITSNAGQTRSITVGDDVRSYGKVIAIYSQQGIVDTSSGKKIEYGPNDR